MQQQPDYREIPTSQIPAMRLANLGFKPLMPEEVMLERKGKTCERVARRYSAFAVA